MITIRRMRPRDARAAIALWKATPGVSSSDDPALIRRILRRNPGGSFVAMDGKRLVGAVIGGHEGRRGLLGHLAVAPTHRRAGLGKALTNKVLDWMRGEGIRKVNILVLRSNRAGLKFWRRLGWEPIRAVAFTHRLTNP